MPNSEHNMRWGFQVLPHGIIVRIYGVVDQRSSEMFEQATERSTKFNKRQIVLDFSDVESVDELGIVFCGYGLHHFQQLSIPVALVRPPVSLLPVLKEHGLPDIPHVFLQGESITNLN